MLADAVDEDAARGLLAAVITRAVKDAHDGRPCNGRCKPGEHACRRDALRFLRSRWCANLLAWLDLPAEVQEDLVAHARHGHAQKRAEP